MADEDDVIDGGEQDGAEEEQGQEQGQQQTAQSIEDVARKHGWAPQDEWRGDPNQWVDAAEFLDAGLDMRKKTLARQDGELSELKQTVGDFRKFMEGSERRQYEREQRAYERGKAEAEAKLQEAIEADDTQAAVRAQAELDSLKEPEAPKPETPKPAVNPLFDKFRAENAWYQDDYEMTAYAHQIADIVAEKGYTGQAFYDELSRATKAKFSDRGKNPARARAPSVEGGGKLGGGGKGNGRTWNDLPPEAKASAERFIKQGIVPDRETYLKHYEWE